MRTWRFSSFYFFYFTTVGVLVPYWGLFLQSRGFNAKEIGQLMAILLLTKLVAPNMWALLADKMTSKKGSAVSLMKQAAFVTFVLYCLMFVVHSFWATAAVMFAFCMFWNATLPQLEAATLNHLNERRDRYGQVRLWGFVGFIVMVQSLGLIMDQTGPAAILPAGALALLTVFFASLLMVSSNNISQKPLADKEPSADKELSEITGELQKATSTESPISFISLIDKNVIFLFGLCLFMQVSHCLLYTSPSPRDLSTSRMPSSA